MSYAARSSIGWSTGCIADLLPAGNCPRLPRRDVVLLPTIQFGPCRNIRESKTEGLVRINRGRTFRIIEVHAGLSHKFLCIDSTNSSTARRRALFASHPLGAADPPEASCGKIASAALGPLPAPAAECCPSGWFGELTHRRTRSPALRPHVCMDRIVTPPETSAFSRIAIRGADTARCFAN
jgi:hypothetical protein